MKKFSLLPALMLLATGLYAELPPRAYEDMRNNSPEYLEIKVLKVSKGLCIACTRQSVEVEAEVLKTVRSAAGLKPGDGILVKYSHYRPRRRWAGPRSVPILKKGTICPAFLRQSADGKYFEPAAGGASFEPSR